MKIRKRYILLILLALLPLLKLIHPNDYCFGYEDLIIIGGFAILFFIPFLVIVFYNLYKISLKKELFNFRPIIIAVVYTVCLLFLLKNHDKNIFKEELYFFKVDGRSNPSYTIRLFNDKSFEFKISEFKKACYYKGEYYLKKDSLFLNKNGTINNINKLDTIYFFNKETLKLIPRTKNFLKFIKK
ncbi:hypothetical protein [Polaribacter porphyrae]|uniref:Uncharacterized protein n=1 Tax=Polaribacter porphyrae TaxID=1137780 RepID=A0A2S7WPG6_9FLAO|nr:hypothetical protein [Polaribacter porphyrae]PQJ79497.1 hypothetical protein BTO18_10075 [Polaribacter porphyrae]